MADWPENRGGFISDFIDKPLSLNIRLHTATMCKLREPVRPVIHHGTG